MSQFVQCLSYPDAQVKLSSEAHSSLINVGESMSKSYKMGTR